MYASIKFRINFVFFLKLMNIVKYFQDCLYINILRLHCKFWIFKLGWINFENYARIFIGYFCMLRLIASLSKNNIGKKNKREWKKQKCATFSRTIELSYPNNNLDNKSMAAMPVSHSVAHSYSVRIQILE